jgi:DNA-binding transcriptional regulator GbsR (MarR family)
MAATRTVRCREIKCDQAIGRLKVHFSLNKPVFSIPSAAMEDLLAGDPDELDPLERQVVDFFVDGVRVLGLPRSIGEIYGLLFISSAALSLDDLVRRLHISKGSASQGLRMLKSLGAVREAGDTTERRTYYEPALDLKRLAGGFIREQIRPHLESGQTKITRLAETTQDLDDPARRQFLNDRIERLENWMRRGRRVLPVLQKLLGQ